MFFQVADIISMTQQILLFAHHSLNINLKQLTRRKFHFKLLNVLNSQFVFFDRKSNSSCLINAFKRGTRIDHLHCLSFCHLTYALKCLYKHYFMYGHILRVTLTYLFNPSNQTRLRVKGSKTKFTIPKHVAAIVQKVNEKKKMCVCHSQSS